MSKNKIKNMEDKSLTLSEIEALPSGSIIGFCENTTGEVLSVDKDFAMLLKIISTPEGAQIFEEELRRETDKEIVDGILAAMNK